LKILVAGVGNLLRSDDGLGPQVVLKLSQIKLPFYVDVMDLGTSGMDILHYSRNYDKVVFIDVIRLAKTPGTVYRIKPREVEVADEDIRNMIYMSMHEIDLEKVIAIGRRLGDMPKDIVIVGCEPEDVTTMRIGLTQKVDSALPKIMELILEEIKSSS
jgi:hydrogenase maturation protease